MINLFPVAGVKHLMVTRVSNTLNAWILLCKTWMGTEKFYYKKLLKAKVTASERVPLLLFLQRLHTNSVNLYWNFKFSKVMSLLHFSWLFGISFPELYISNLTVIISSMFCTGAFETVKSCISPFFLLADLYFQVVNFLVKMYHLLQLGF